MITSEGDTFKALGKEIEISWRKLAKYNERDKNDVLHKGDHSPQTFNKVCNILSEYAESIHCNAGTESHYKEHFTLILAKHALQALKQL